MVPFSTTSRAPPAGEASHDITDDVTDDPRWLFTVRLITAFISHQCGSGLGPRRLDPQKLLQLKQRKIISSGSAAQLLA